MILSKNLVEQVKDRVKLKLIQMNCSVRQIAINCNISTYAFNNLMRDKARLPRGDTLLKIASALNCSVDWLLTGKEFLTTKNDKNNDNIITIKLVDENKYLYFDKNIINYNDNANLLIIKNQHNNMAPEFKKNSYLIVDTNIININGMYVIKNGNDYIVKKCQFIKEKIRLSCNAFPSVIICKSQIYIIGKVVCNTQ